MLEYEGTAYAGFQRQALVGLEGERDFGPFSAPVGPGRSTVRRLYRTALWKQDDTVYLELEGNAFLPQQVRRIGAAALRVGLGKLTLQEFMALATDSRQGAAPWILPPYGLCLQEVKYQGFPL